jgi:hypothetical protein
MLKFETIQPADYTELTPKPMRSKAHGRRN